MSLYQNISSANLSPWSRVLRRLDQLRTICFSRQFKNYESSMKSVCKRYSESEELNFYSSVAFNNFVDFELEAIERIESQLPQESQKVLVVGCGAGREAFAFEKRGYTVTATDLSEAMIKKARNIAKEVKSEVEFHHGTWPDAEKKFDLVFVSSFLTSHIPGRENRIQFFKEARKRFHIALCFAPDIMPIHPLSHHGFVSSLLFLRSLFNFSHWQKGDVLRSYLGSHTTSGTLAYYHYYQSSQEVLSEISTAGLTCEPLSQGYWIAREDFNPKKIKELKQDRYKKENSTCRATWSEA